MQKAIRETEGCALHFETVRPRQRPVEATAIIEARQGIEVEDTSSVEREGVPIHLAGHADLAVRSLADGQGCARGPVHRDIAKEVGCQRISCSHWIEVFNQDSVSPCHWQRDGRRKREDIARWSQDPKSFSLLRLKEERDLVALGAGQGEEV